MRLCEELKIVPIIEAVDLAGGAATAESVCMKNYSHATFVFNFGAITGNSVLTIAEGATDAAATAALTFAYRYTSANALAASQYVQQPEAFFRQLREGSEAQL